MFKFKKLFCKQKEYDLNASEARNTTLLSQYNSIMKKITERAKKGHTDIIILFKCILQEVVEKLENDGFNVETTSSDYTAISWWNPKNDGLKSIKIRELSILSQYNSVIERINDYAREGVVSTKIFDMYPEVIEKLKNNGFDIVITSGSKLAEISWGNIGAKKEP